LGESKVVNEELRPAPLWVRAAATVIRHLPAGRYRLMNFISRRPPGPFLTRLPKELGAYSFRCDLRDSISREACFVGHYEAQETALMCHLLKQGMCFVDVGANWGYHTLLAAYLVGERGKVVSLEPDPRLFSTLEENVKRNRLQQVTPFQVAASSENGVIRLIGYDETEGNFGLSHIDSDNGAKNSFEAKAQTLDELFDELALERIDLLKMDIEGAEGFALKGASKVLSDYRIHRLLLELHPLLLDQHGHSAEEIISRLFELGYRAWKIDHSFAVTRKVSYNRNVDLKTLLQTFEQKTPLDDWPHLIWLKPGLEETW
jgi:FkbM family methyltransferase